jgi:hypothetical protein
MLRQRPDQIDEAFQKTGPFIFNQQNLKGNTNALVETEALLQELSNRIALHRIEIRSLKCSFRDHAKPGQKIDRI